MKIHEDQKHYSGKQNKRFQIYVITQHDEILIFGRNLNFIGYGFFNNVCNFLKNFLGLYI